MNIREANIDDLAEITRIFNEGIEDKIATYRLSPVSLNNRAAWYMMRPRRYKILVAQGEGAALLGWASINKVSHSTAAGVYDGIANISVYVSRSARGQGVGKKLMTAIEQTAIAEGFFRMELDVFDFNTAAMKLYKDCGFREVGTYFSRAKYGDVDTNVVLMEKKLGDR